jgi:hypothetical protein
MTAFVIDTNVPIVANGKADHVDDPDCVITALQMLKQVREKGTLVLDCEGLILKEYRDSSHLNMLGQPGAGDFFIKWAYDNQANARYCRQVRITPKGDDDQDFEEFPNDDALAGFDRSDRKFVAVAAASKDNPEIVNASDTDWWIYREALQSHGFRINFLCPELMEKKPLQKPRHRVSAKKSKS